MHLKLLTEHISLHLSLNVLAGRFPLKKKAPILLESQLCFSLFYDSEVLLPKTKQIPSLFKFLSLIKPSTLSSSVRQKKTSRLSPIHSQ